MNPDQLDVIANGSGFIAALDQSGGSTPKALQEYGVDPSAYSTDEEMFALVHQMRARIMASPAFRGDRIIGAILFEGTMEREIDGMGSVEYLWRKKKIVPFVKVDQGLADEVDGVQLMKPLSHLVRLLDRATAKGIFGTKMRSVVKDANSEGIDKVLDQQFEVADQVRDVGLLPIIEPEVDIRSSTRAEADELLVAGIHRRLGRLPTGAQIALKLSLPARPGHYSELVEHPAVVRVLALSGGYSRDEAVAVLADNRGVIASFSRAFLQGLSAAQSAAEFDAALLETVEAIYMASTT
jgi:fructose-bisphosphate aldolase class I